MNKTVVLIMALTFGALAASPTLAAEKAKPAKAGAPGGKLYKWVDENGEIHYGDAVPPEQVKEQHKQLNRQGITVGSVEKAKAKEQLEQEAREQEQAKQQAAAAERARRDQQARDRVLLDTYVSEKDIIDARDRNLTTLDGTISLTTANLQRLQATRDKLKKEVAEHKTDSEPAKKAQSQLADTEKQISNYELYIKSKRGEQDAIRAKFEQDLQRFRELKSAQPAG